MVSFLYIPLRPEWGFPGGAVVKDPPANAGDIGLIPRLGRSPGGGNGNPFQYSCLGNSMAEDPGRLQSTGLQRVGHDWTQRHTDLRSKPSFFWLSCGHTYALVNSEALQTWKHLCFQVFLWGRKIWLTLLTQWKGKPRWSKEAGQAFRLVWSQDKTPLIFGQFSSNPS